MKTLVDYIIEGSIIQKMKKLKEKASFKLFGELPKNHIRIGCFYIELHGGKYYSNNTPTVCKQIKNIIKKYTHNEPYFKNDLNINFSFDLTNVSDIDNVVDKIYDEVIKMYKNKYEITDESDDKYRVISIRVNNASKDSAGNYVEDGIYEYVNVEFRYK